MIDYKFITYPYLKNFKCSADKCPSTCCYGWNVKVDNKTLENYKNLCNSFGDYLVEHISQHSNNIYMKKDYCPFLDSEKMCKIQKNYGLDMLCDVCKNYPRTKKYLINIELNSMVLSCPEVINAIKKANIYNEEIEVVQIKGKETKQETLTLKLYNYFHNKLKFIYDKKANLYKTMYVLTLFAYDAEKYFKQKLTEKNVEEFYNRFDKKYFNSLYKTYKIKKDYEYIKMTQLNLIKDITKYTISNKNLKQFFKDYTTLKFDSINFKSLYKKTSKSLNKNVNLYNILFFIINSKIFNMIKEKDFVVYLNCILTYITLVQTLSIASYSIDKLRFKTNSLILASNLYRFIFHIADFETIIFRLNGFPFCFKESLCKYLSSF